MMRFYSLMEKERKGNIVPNPMKRLNKEVEKRINWLINWSNSPLSEVTSTLFVEKLVINLELHTCSCSLWDLSGVP